MTKYYLRYKYKGKYTFVPTAYSTRVNALMIGKMLAYEKPYAVDVSTTKKGTAIGRIAFLSNGPGSLGSYRKTMTTYLTPTAIYEIKDKGKLEYIGPNKADKTAWKADHTLTKPKTKRRASEDIFAWYRDEPKSKPKSTPKTKPKEQPANLMSSKFMKDHIIIARPGKPVSRAPTGFTWQAFNERFNYYYDEMYEGRLDDSREWVEKGDRILQTKKEFVKNFVIYRQDVISSDRETAALARTFEYFQKKGMIKN